MRAERRTGSLCWYLRVHCSVKVSEKLKFKKRTMNTIKKYNFTLD